MSPKLFKKKTWSDESGVSEIIGNILILMITVVLFSGIMAFVNQMPVPEMATKTDFVGSVSFDDSGTVATITLTHSGGAVLPSTDTTVFVLIDDVSYIYKLSADAEFSHDYWTTGLDWSKSFTETSYSSVITVTVIDDVKHSSIWVSQLSGGMGGSPPTILQRYVDSDILTSTADYVKEGDDFSLFVKVIDLDGDLDTSTSGIWVDASSIGGGSVDTYDAASGGWFRWDYANLTSESRTVDGKVLIIHATDLAGHETISNFKISVVVLPVDTRNIYSELPTDEGGLPSYLSFSSPILGSGYGVYGENLTNGTSGRADVNDARTIFNKDELIFVRVGSTQMTNILGMNELEIADTRTGLTYTPQYRYNSSAESPFYVYGSSGSAQIYQCIFNTSGLPPSAYNMNIYLRSAGTDEVVFQTDITLIIQQADSPITFIPQIYLFADVNRTTPWGTKTLPYEVNGETHTIYASVNVQDAQETPPFPVVGEVRIEDMTGGAELYGSPPAGAMISNFWYDVTNNSQRYNFTIDLRINNADQWLSGKNSYTIRISSFSDNNEGVYRLAKQVYIKASVSKTDFFTGTNGIYSTRGGSTNFINPEYIYYIENNNFFTTRILHDQSNSPSSAPLYYMTAMAVGDLDGDADDDLIAAQFKPSGAGYVAEGHLLYFENSMNSYGTWQSPSFITRASTDDTTVLIDWIATGDTNGDGDIDIVYATADHEVFIYNNTYGAAAVSVFSSAFGSTNDGVRKLDLMDMNGDGAADLIVLANGVVKIFDLKNWKTTQEIARIPTSGNANIEDFDIADVDGDGTYDILTANPTSSGSGCTGVYVNYYSQSASPTYKTFENYSAFNPVIPYGEMDPTTDVSGAQSDGGSYLSLYEDTVTSNLSATFKVVTLTADLDQILHVKAKTVGNDESFYIWYSIDSTDGTDGRFTPVIVVTNGTSDWTEFEYRFPSNVAGHTIFLRVTDSLNTFGSIQDELQLDWVVVKSDVFGTYTSDTQQIVPYSASNLYYCVRAANIDGIGELEVIAARNGNWSTYYTSGSQQFVSGWSVSNSYFYVYGTGMTGVSPTLFTVADVNGDSYSDVVACFTRSDINDDERISVIGVYINIDSYWYIEIKDHYAGYLTGTEKGTILYLLVADVMHEGT